MATSEELLDISDIPYFPYVPGLVQWCGFLVIGVLVIISLVFISKKKRRSKVNQALETCQREIEGLTLYLQQHQEQSKDLLSRASLLTRRFVSSVSEDISNYSPNEFEKFKNRSSNPSIAKLVGCILEVESYKYSPNNDPKTALEYLRNISLSLKDYKNYMVENKS